MNKPKDRVKGRRWRRWFGCAVATVVLAWLVTTFIATWALTHRPRAMAAEIAAPAEWAAENVQLATRDGQTLGAWLVRGRPEAPAVVLLHGLRGSRRNFLPLIDRLRGDGCTVLAVTLRAHGDSTGENVDFGYSSRTDVIAAVQHLRAITTPTTPVIVCGTSLGSAAALFAAKELGTQVQGYLLESPYRDLRTAVQNRLKMRLPTLLRPAAYAGLWLWGHVLLPVSPNQISPMEAAGDVPAGVPVVILAGSKDRYSTVSEAADIYERVKSPRALVKFNGGGHATLYRKDPEKYYAALLSCLNELSDQAAKARK